MNIETEIGIWIEIEIEREKSLSQTKIDISAVDKRIKGEYASR